MSQHITGITRIVVTAALCLVTGCATPLAQNVSAIGRTRVLADWEDVFKQSDSTWLGSDAAYSVPLSADKTLWLFGDTWIGAKENEGRKGARLIRNSIGVQSISGQRPDPIKYHWKMNAANNEPGAFLDGAMADSWYWPLDGIRVDDKLLLFVSRLVEGGGMGFSGVGNAMLVVNNPDAAPDDWSWKPHPIPYYRNTEHGERVFGLSVERVDDFIYVHGAHTDWRRGMGGRGVVVARTTVEALKDNDFSNWRFFDGNAWNENADSAKELFLEAGSEMSVHFDAALDRFIAVYTRFGLSDEIMARFARHPEGPWSEAVVVYRCPEVNENSNYFCYAAKAHPEYEIGNGETLITYAVNSSNFGDHFSDQDLYWPRCIGVRLVAFIDEAERR